MKGAFLCGIFTKNICVKFYVLHSIMKSFFLFNTYLSLNQLYLVRLFRFVFALLSQHSATMFPLPSFVKSKNSPQSMRCFKLRKV